MRQAFVRLLVITYKTGYFAMFSLSLVPYLPYLIILLFPTVHYTSANMLLPVKRLVN